jgi:UDP-N-acetyl-D-glucosamine dehydrogenase
MASEHLGVVGLGYVGLPLSISFAEAGYAVTGVDVDSRRVEALHARNSYVDDVSDERLGAALDGTLDVTTAQEALGAVDCVAVCVPTPLEKTQQPNLSYLVDAVEDLAGVLQEGCTVVIESTLYPRATEDIVVPIFEEHGHVVGETLYVAHSPERIDPGNESYELTEIPKVLGGLTEECTIRAQAYYEEVFDRIVTVPSATEAEFAKILENTFRTVNIALINELATVAHELDVDIWDTIDAAATKPFGFMPFYPGPGLGGHCLPIDPLYLSWQAGQHGMETEFIQLADRINRSMPKHVVERITSILNRAGIPITDARVLIVGVAYKPDVSDVRESPAFDVISLLEDREASVEYHDPHVEAIDFDGCTYESVPLETAQIKAADITVIMTPHSTLDISEIVKPSVRVFDTRNATTGMEDNDVHRL